MKARLKISDVHVERQLLADRAAGLCDLEPQTIYEYISGLPRARKKLLKMKRGRQEKPSVVRPRRNVTISAI